MTCWTKYSIKLSLPLFATIVILLIALIDDVWNRVFTKQKACSNRTKGFSLKTFLSEKIAPLIILFAVAMYAFLVSSATRPFKCKSNSTKYTLVDNPSINCFEEEWNMYFPIAIFFTVLYGIGLPGILIYLFWKNRKNIASETFKQMFGNVTEVSYDFFLVGTGAGV